MIRIFLIGYMGTGKTTLGKAFSQLKHLTFIDLDWYIEERYHKTIQQLFAAYGEDGFREIERRMLHEVSDFENVVIAAGGGTPCFFDNMDYMNEKGETIFLHAELETLFNRLKQATSQRPLLANKSDEELRDYIAKGLGERNPYYLKAKYKFASDALESREQITESVQQLTELLNI